MASESQVLQVIAYLAAAYPNQTVSGETASVYTEQLIDQDPELLLLAARQLVQEEEFLPTVASILKRVRGLGIERQMWLCSANYALDGELPDHLRLPAGMRARWLKEPANVPMLS